MGKIGLLFDERLSHDRKNVFHRNMSILKMKYSLEFLPRGLEEDTLIEFAQKEKLETILLPWHLYFIWKKAANLSETRVLGYFAEPLLPFEFQTIPNYPNFALLDFYHYSIDEMELQLKFLTTFSNDTEILEVFGKTARYMTKDWFPMDQDSTICVDQIFETPILQVSPFTDQVPRLRFFITALWLACFQDKAPSGAVDEPAARFVLGEFNKKLLIQLTFTSALTSKEVMQELWPTGDHRNAIFRELALHSDLLKVYHFPKTRMVSITGLFLPETNGLAQSGEVRGFWVENRL